MSINIAHDVPAPGRWDRRGFLRYGSLGLLSAALGHGWPGRAAAGKAGRAPARADACIIVLLTGGPSHLDLWDLKPNAPAEVRGPFGGIATRVPGLRLCEHLPKLARQVHRCALVRSVHHKASARHSAAAYVALTGVEGGDVVRPASRSDHPAFGSVIAMKRGRGDFPLPYVWLPFRTTEVELGARPIPGMLGGFLGSRFDPFFVLGDLTDPEFSVPGLAPQASVGAERLRARLQLLNSLNRRQPAAPAPEWREAQERASDLVTRCCWPAAGSRKARCSAAAISGRRTRTPTRQPRRHSCDGLRVHRALCRSRPQGGGPDGKARGGGPGGEAYRSAHRIRHGGPFRDSGICGLRRPVPKESMQHLRRARPLTARELEPSRVFRERGRGTVARKRGRAGANLSPFFRPWNNRGSGTPASDSMK